MRLVSAAVLLLLFVGAALCRPACTFQTPDPTNPGKFLYYDLSAYSFPPNAVNSFIQGSSRHTFFLTDNFSFQNSHSRLQDLSLRPTASLPSTCGAFRRPLSAPRSPHAIFFSLAAPRLPQPSVAPATLPVKIAAHAQRASLTPLLHSVREGSGGRCLLLRRSLDLGSEPVPGSRLHGAESLGRSDCHCHRRHSVPRAQSPDRPVPQVRPQCSKGHSRRWDH